MSFPVGARTTGELITASIWNADLKDNLNTLRGGGIAMTSQANLDVIIGTGSATLGRVPTAASALQVFRKNAANNGYEFATLTAELLNDNGGRLTLESGVAVSTTDQSAKTTLYFTPYINSQIALFDGSATWNVRSFSELSITLASLTASTPYDVFCYDNAGTATLELLIWTDATTRATALVKQDGRWVKSGATTRRYLGTIYINATGGQSDDTYAKRYVWNANNRVVRPMRVVETTASWTYDGAAFRQVRATTTNQLDFVVGLPDVSVNGRVVHYAVCSSGAGFQSTAIGLDSTTTIAPGSLASKNKSSNAGNTLTGSVSTYPGIGRHRLVWLEYGDGAATTWNGVADGFQSGIDGFIEG